MKESHQLNLNSSLGSVVKELQLFSSINRNRKRNSSQLLAKKKAGSLIIKCKKATQVSTVVSHITWHKSNSELQSGCYTLYLM